MKKRTRKLQHIQKKINKMTLISSNLSTITLKVNGLSSPIKMYKVGKIDLELIICCLQQTHSSFKDTSKLKVKARQEIFLDSKTKHEQE